MAYKLTENEKKFIDKMKGYKFTKKIGHLRKKTLHPITALLNECDFTLQDFEIKLGLHPGSVMSAIHRSGHKKAEAYLSYFLEKPLAELWPQKYDKNFFTELEKIEIESALTNVAHPLFPFRSNDQMDWPVDNIRDAIIVATGEPIRLHQSSEKINRALVGNSSEGEVIIAEIIGTYPHQIWPERYHKRRVSVSGNEESSAEIIDLNEQWHEQGGNVSLPPGVKNND